MGLLTFIFLTFSLEVTSIIITEQVYLAQAINSTSLCEYTEDFQLSESNKLTLCVKEKKIHIEVDRFNISEEATLWLNDEDWNEFKRIFVTYLMI